MEKSGRCIRNITNTLKISCISHTIPLITIANVIHSRVNSFFNLRESNF